MAAPEKVTTGTPPGSGNTNPDAPTKITTDAGKAQTIAEAKSGPVRKSQTTRGRRQAQQADGPLYRVTALSQIDNALCGPGTDRETVVYFGLPGSKLVPINAEAKKRKEAVKKIRQGKGSAEEQTEQLAELSNEWNGVEARDEFADAADED